MTTSHFIIVDDTLSEKNLSDLSDELSGVDGIHQVLSYEKFVGGAIPEMFIPDDVRDIFEAGGHKMILANSSYKSGSDEQNNQLSEMIDIVKKYDPNGVITGEGAMTKDLIEVADVDFNNVNTQVSLSCSSLSPSCSAPLLFRCCSLRLLKAPS